MEMGRKLEYFIVSNVCFIKPNTSFKLPFKSGDICENINMPYVKA